MTYLRPDTRESGDHHGDHKAGPEHQALDAIRCLGVSTGDQPVEGRDRDPSDPDVQTPKPLEPRTELPPSARLVAEVRSGLGVTRELFARMTGFSVRAISGWEAGRPMSEPALRRTKEMKRLRDLLAEGLRPRFIPQWLETPCAGLGGLKPVEVLERSQTDRLWRTVLSIGSGMPACRPEFLVKRSPQGTRFW